MSIQSDAGELDKKFLVRLRKIDSPRAIALNDVPAEFEIVDRQPQLVRENIHGADGQKPERRVGAGETVHDFVNGAVATRCHDFF